MTIDETLRFMRFLYHHTLVDVYYQAAKCKDFKDIQEFFKCTSPGGMISLAFPWDDTPQGHNFWNNVNTIWARYMEDGQGPHETIIPNARAFKMIPREYMEAIFRDNSLRNMVYFHFEKEPIAHSKVTKTSGSYYLNELEPKRSNAAKLHTLGIDKKQLRNWFPASASKCYGWDEEDRTDFPEVMDDESMYDMLDILYQYDEKRLAAKKEEAPFTPEDVTSKNFELKLKPIGDAIYRDIPKFPVNIIPTANIVSQCLGSITAIDGPCSGLPKKEESEPAPHKPERKVKHITL